MKRIKINRNQYYVYKISSKRLKNKKWNLTLTPREARRNNEVVKLAESQAIRFINEIRCNIFPDNEHKKLLKQINKLKKMPKTDESKLMLKEKYNILDEKFFLQDYIFIEMSENSHYELLSKKSFKLNGLRYYRLYATTGGGKNGIVVFASQKVFPELSKRINNNRNEEIPLVPAKLEAYKALASSASVPVTLLNDNSVACIKDYEHTIYKDVTYIHNNEEMTIEQKDNHPLNVNINDGFGFISYRLAQHWAAELGLDYVPSGFCVRFAYTKGMLYVFDYHKFSKEIANTSTYTDAWNNTHTNIDNIDIVLTSSMLKLWKAYDSIDDFMETSFDNGFTFAVTKTTPNKLENERNLTYQYIQSLNLSDEKIRELVNPTIKFIKELRGDDWKSSILFLKGTHLTDKSVSSLDYDFAQALMISPDEMINDPFVRSNLKKMSNKMIKDAKIGRVRVNGNYQLLSGDPYALAQHMFNEPVTGLLQDGEFYSNYWNERNVSKVACFRAPMSCHENIRILNLKKDDKVNEWYKHMNTVLILNAWDTTTHALNGCDYDGDAVMTTDNHIIINGITPMKAIICEQGVSKPKLVTEQDLIEANKNSKGNDIGSITNKATAMYDLLPLYLDDLHTYTLILNRIRRCQKLQQDSIDKAKGVEGFSMPKEWYDYNANVIKDEQGNITFKNDININILADKNPYFLRYRYDHLNKEYQDYIKANSRNCINRFGISLETLINKENKTDEENQFLNYYYKKMPLTMGNSVMNRLCWMIEDEFDQRTRDKVPYFDYTILKSPKVDYEIDTYKEIQELYDEYIQAVQYFEAKKNDFNEEEDEVNANQRDILVERFQELAYEVCNNEDIVCNIVVDMVYKKDDLSKNSKEKSKQFAWDVAGRTIISNLLKRSNFTLNYLELDPTGDVHFNGERFSVVVKKLSEKDDTDK